ncbi:MAG: hypothetical protein US38_C0003G0079, partial [Candidatus Roizmanbacteria bacterium GW2011_GWC1_37_12]
ADPPNWKMERVENRRSEAEADLSSVAKSGGGKESRATERGMDLLELSRASYYNSTFVSADQLSIKEAEVPERLARACLCLKVQLADRMASRLVYPERTCPEFH